MNYCISYEHQEVYSVTPTPCFSAWICCKDLKTYLYYLYNAGSHPITLSLQLSPNQIVFVEDRGPFTLSPGETIYLEPLAFSFYIRVCFYTNYCTCSHLCLWFQSQFS